MNYREHRARVLDHFAHNPPVGLILDMNTVNIKINKTVKWKEFPTREDASLTYFELLYQTVDHETSREIEEYKRGKDG